MARRRSLLLALAATPALAQLDWRRDALPYYTPPQLLTAFRLHQQLPGAQALDAAAQTLIDALQQPDSGAARAAWRQALAAWLRLSTVSTGPLLSRRSAVRLDFPLREALLRRTLAAPAQPLQRQGAAVQGLGALEWLLWTPGALEGNGRLHAQACAQALRDEALALQAALQQPDPDSDDEEAQVNAFDTWFNQLLAGLAQLRQQGIERPLGEARSRGLSQPHLPRSLSGAAAEERQLRWAVLEAQLRHPDGQPAPRPDTALISVEALLRGRGENPLADRLLAALQPAAAALQAAEANEPAKLQAAAQALARLQRFIELELSEALALRVAFSSADGD